MILRPSSSCRLLALLLVAIAFDVAAGPSNADEKSTSQVYLLSCPEDATAWSLPAKNLHWQTLHKVLDEKAGQLIRVALRADVAPSLYIDTQGLRLFVATEECLEHLKKLPAESQDQVTLDYLVRNLLLRRYSATGIEPDRIPVHKEPGKKPCLDGMVLIKGGEYVRSGRYHTSQSAEVAERTGDRYRVQVSEFHIDKYKVSNADYCEFLNDGNPGYWNSAPWSNIRRDADGRFVVDEDKAKWPVIAVNWYQAAGYAEWAGKQLPTEAQWEFAAGGSEGRKYPWGNELPEETRGYSLSSGDYTPVDAFPAGATPDGVFGLAGNAAEWCADFYSHDYYDKAPQDGLLKDPRGPTIGTAAQGYPRMFKGFCQGRSPELLECTKRHARAPLLTAAIGFRCVKGCG